MDNRGGLMRQLMLVFGSVILAAAVLMHLSNRYISRYPSDLLAYNAKALTVIFTVWMMIFGGYAWFRLRPYLNMREDGNDADQTALWVRLTRFPAELFGLALVLGFIATGGYAFAEHRYMSETGLMVPGGAVWIWQAKGTVLNLSSAFLLAAVFYGLARLILRPHVIQVQRIDVSRVSFRSFSRQLIVTFVIVLALVIIRILWYALNSRLHQEPIRWPVLFAISALGLFGGMLLFYLIATGYRRQAQSIQVRIYRLIREGKTGMPRKVSVTANDETGELAAALNDLQIRLSRDYAELEEELLLARKVRDRLFTEPQALFGSFAISFNRRTDDEPGGDFYDIAEAGNRHMAVIAGCVPEKGAAAVLIISALLALFRSEARKGGTAASILRRLQGAWTESFPDLAAVSAGLVLIDRMNPTAAVSLTGEAAAVLLPGRGPRCKLPMRPCGRDGLAEADWKPESGDALQVGLVRAPLLKEADAADEITFWLQITRR